MYTDTVMDHVRHPRNGGELPEPDGAAQDSDPDCGDVVRVTLRARGGLVTEVRYKAFGGPVCVAAGSVATELARGRTLREARAISADDVVRDLGGVPPGKERSVELVVRTVRAAAADATGTG